MSVKGKLFTVTPTCVFTQGILALVSVICDFCLESFVVLFTESASRLLVRFCRGKSIDSGY